MYRWIKTAGQSKTIILSASRRQSFSYRASCTIKSKLLRKINKNHVAWAQITFTRQLQSVPSSMRGKGAARAPSKPKEQLCSLKIWISTTQPLTPSLLTLTANLNVQSSSPFLHTISRLLTTSPIYTVAGRKKLRLSCINLALLNNTSALSLTTRY